MSPFALEEPASLAEALALLDPDDPAVRAIAGGTALMLMMKSGLYQPQRLVSLRRLGPALTGIRAAADGGLDIGAMVRLAEIERSAAVRANNELITAVSIPPQAAWRAVYAKCTARTADDWPALGLAVSVHAEDGQLRDARLAIGAATETARRLPAAEAALAGRAIDDATLREAGRAAAAEAPVVADHHGSAAYKRVLIEVHLRRALRRVLDGGLR